MQEWLTKSGQNVSSQAQLQSMQNPGQHAQLLAAQAAQIAAQHNHQSASQLQHSAPTSKNKFVQKPGLSGLETSNSQISLTKQQHQQLQQIQMAKQNLAHGMDRAQNHLNRSND